MPPATYESALGDAGFLSMLGAMYQQANQLEVAQVCLSGRRSCRRGGRTTERSARVAIGGSLPAAQQTDQAYGMYHQFWPRIQIAWMRGAV